jgi:hypothetical protein
MREYPELEVMALLHRPFLYLADVRPEPFYGLIEDARQRILASQSWELLLH